MTPAPVTGGVAQAATRLGQAVDAEHTATQRWDTAASALAAAQHQAAGNPAYRQTAHLWDDPANLGGRDPETRATLTHLYDHMAAARADRDHAGRAVVAARQALHQAQQNATFAWATA